MEIKKHNIILLHGALGSSQSFNHLLPIFSSTFNIWTFDFIGHGENSISSNISANLLCDQLINYIIENKLEGASVFGYSMGGYVALMAGIKKAELFEKIITLGTKLNWNNEIAQHEIKQLEYIKSLPSTHPFIMQLIALHGHDQYLNCVKETEQLMLELGEKQILNSNTLAKIKNQVLLLIGANDNMVSINETEGAAKYIKHSECKIIPETKHPIEKVDVNVLHSIINTYLGEM